MECYNGRTCRLCCASRKSRKQAVGSTRSPDFCTAGKAKQGRGTSFNKLHVPVKIVPPAIRDFLKRDGYPDGRHPFGPGWSSDERHCGLRRGTPTLLPVALNATGHNVFPFGFPPPRFRYDVVVSEIFGIKSAAAILALVPIPRVYVLPGEFDGTFWALYHS